MTIEVTDVSIAFPRELFPSYTDEHQFEVSINFADEQLRQEIRFKISVRLDLSKTLDETYSTILQAAENVLRSCADHLAMTTPEMLNDRYKAPSKPSVSESDEDDDLFVVDE